MDNKIVWAVQLLTELSNLDPTVVREVVFLDYDTAFSFWMKEANYFQRLESVKDARIIGNRGYYRQPSMEFLVKGKRFSLDIFRKFI